MEKSLTQKRIEHAVLEIDAILRTNGTKLELLPSDQVDIVQVLIAGDCPSCGNSMMTLERGIERMIKEQVPEVKQVIVSRPPAS